MPLNLDLLPDKPQATKSSFSLDLESLPDKPQSLKKSNRSLDLDSSPDKPQGNWVAEGLKQTVKDIGKGFADVPAQAQDLITMPARLLGTPHPPMVSKLATETMPYLAQKATSPLFEAQVPVVTPRNIKPLLTGKFQNIETTPVAPSPLDLAVILGIPAYQTAKNVIGKMQWNAQIDKALQTEKIKSVVMENIAPLESVLEQGGIRLPKDLPIEDKVNVILSQAEKSPTLGTAISQLAKGKLKPVIPKTNIVETTATPEATVKETLFTGRPVESGKAITPKAPEVPQGAPVAPSVAPVGPQTNIVTPSVFTGKPQAPIPKSIEPSIPLKEAELLHTEIPTLKQGVTGKVWAPNIAANPTEYFSAQIRDKGWAVDEKLFKDPREAYKWITQHSGEPSTAVNKQYVGFGENLKGMAKAGAVDVKVESETPKQESLSEIRVTPGYVGDEQYKQNLLTNLRQYESVVNKTPEILKDIEDAKRRLAELERGGEAEESANLPVIYSPEDLQIISEIKSEIEQGRPGYKWLGPEDSYAPGKRKVGFEPSTYPPYFQNKGYTKKNTLNIINKIESGKPLTAKQKFIVDDLIQSRKEQINEETRIKAKGVTQSEIDEADRIGEAQALSEVEVGENNGVKYFSTPEEAFAYIDDIESKGGQAQIIRVNENEVEVSFNLPETLTPSGQIKPELQAPLKKDLFQEAGELFTSETKLPPHLQAIADKIKGVEDVTPLGFGPGGGGKAFATPPGGLEEWIKRTQDQNIQLKPLEMPELVKLAHELMGKYPVVKKLVTNLGLFKFGKGIALDVKIFKNPQLAGIVLAHEIGHLIDWLPDYAIARGNILGRIATLKRYMKSLLGEKPGTESTVLTPEDRERLRAEAKKQLTAERKLGEREVIEEIIREIPIYEGNKITPDVILSLWKEAATEMRTTHPELYRFIAELSGVQKDLVIKQALRGIVDERILQMDKGKRVGTKTVKEQVRRTITPAEITPQNISRKFKELLKKEIIKRKLFEKEVIMEELKKVTQWWNPFDDSKMGWYVKYRYKSEELYAEAISVLLNKPEKLEELAPQFYKAFWNYINQKPEVKKALLELQDFLNMGEGERLRVRQEDIYSMFKKGEELFYDKRKEYELNKKSLWFKLRTELIDRNTAVLDKLKEAQKQGKIINPEDNPRFYLEEYNYIGGKIKNLLGKIDDTVITPLAKEGITQENIGEYLFLNRVVTERADIANPLGHNRETAQRQLDYLKALLGEDKFKLLDTAIGKFRAIMQDLLLQAEKEGLYKPEVIKELLTNPAYATFQVLDYLDNYVTPSIIHQIGTLKPIANPFASTILKMISTLRTIERIKTNNSVIDFMNLNFPGEIEKAKVRHIGKYKSEIPEKEGFEIVKTRENGKLAGYYVDPYIAQSVNSAPRNINNAVVSVLRFFNSGYFRPVYVNLNLGFQTFNFMRDFMRAWKLNPNANFPQMLGYYWKALPIAKQRIWGNFSEPVINEMQQNGMLSFTYNNLMRGVSEGEETQVEFLLRQYDILKKNPDNPIMKVFNWIEEIGDFIETIPKVAGYLSRLKSGQNIKETAHQVRIYSGSPDFLRKGAGYDWYNNVFLFSNAIKEGIRGDLEGAFKEPKTKSGYWWRTAKMNFLPKILMFLASLGFFGQKIKENFDKQSEYDKTNYNNIPLGMTDDNQAIYLRLPQDEMGRLLGGIFWKNLNLVKDRDLKSAQDIAGLLGGQLPSISPEIEIVSNWAQYLTGKNPYDWFRGREILSDDEQLAGGWYSLKPMFAYTGGKLGVYAFTINGKRGEGSTFEQIVKFTPIVQRFIRIADYDQIDRADKQEYRKFKAIRTLERRR